MIKAFRKTSLIMLSAFLLLSAGFAAQAQNADPGKMVMTISPPLIKNTMNPGDSWASTIKLLNNGDEAITLYARIVDFKGSESGGVEFIGFENDGSEESASLKRFSLSRWMDINKDPIKIPAHESVQVPFAIRLPGDAEPGGHYAAIIVGNKPADDKLEGSGMKISSYLSSLVLLEVTGQIEEKAAIREFSTNRTIYNNNDKVVFTLKMENDGTVHVQPQGEIQITDMWGRLRGTVPFNNNPGAYGNILPQSARRWSLDWSNKLNLWDMGRYKASIVVAYGETTKDNISQELTFWVVNFTALGIAVGSIALFIFLITLMVKLSVRRAVKNVQKLAGTSRPVAPPPVASQPVSMPSQEEKPHTKPAASASAAKKVVDLRERMK